MAAKEASSETTTPWSYHPVYARYWQHYYQAMAWMRSHQNAYRKAVESYFGSPWYFAPGGVPQSSHAKKGVSPQSCGDHLAPQDSHCGYSLSPRSGQHPQGRTREDQAWAAEEEVETDSDEEVEYDLSNMEITEELRQYFAETERHREERRKCRAAFTCFLSLPCILQFYLP
ncbi:PREDICTED: gem-associated protein 8 [Miniopterus natalensis]|uniref:gem-associated protein 8 n=1 Tax=Miniopterus natalensis TaxID=291302 RepID=UPI0007A72F05|nr:PREDICTED: gem-associated protein 8 [Miniopterus natalensis]